MAGDPPTPADDLVRRLDRRQRRALVAVSGLAALLVLLVLGVLFYWWTYLLGPSGSPFTRGPYLTRVQGGEAQLRWRTDGSRAVDVRAVAPDGTVVRADGDGLLRGLAPSTRYAWTAAVGGRVAAAGSFSTPAPPGTAAPLVLVAFADYGAGGDHEWAVARIAAAQRPDLAIAAGDNSYLAATDRLLDRNIFRPLGELLREAPLYAVLGTPHDVVLDGGRSVRSALDIPQSDRREVVYGDVQVVMLGVQSSDAGVREFARQALAHGPFRHRLVVLHDPLKAGDPLLPVLRAAHVDAVISGNLHRYERRDVQGVVQLVVGTGGAPQSGEFTPRSADAVVSLEGFGVLRLDVDGARIRGRFLDEAGAIRDAFELP